MERDACTLGAWAELFAQEYRHGASKHVICHWASEGVKREDTGWRGMHGVHLCLYCRSSDRDLECQNIRSCLEGVTTWTRIVQPLDRTAKGSCSMQAFLCVQLHGVSVVKQQG